SQKDEEAGFDMLKKLVDLRPMWSKDQDSIVNALRDEEALIAFLPKAQSYTARDLGGSVGWVFPKEGAIAFSSGHAVVKNSKNRELAEIYLNITLDPKVQAEFVKAQNYSGSNKKTPDFLSAEKKERGTLSESELSRLVELDQEFIGDRLPA